MKIRLIVLTAICLGSFSQDTWSQNLNPKYSGQLWVDAYYQDRYKDSDGNDYSLMSIQVPRVLLGVDVSVAKGWNVSMSYIGSTSSSARVNHAYIENTHWLPGQGVWRLGRVELPYYSFVKKSFSHRWALLSTQAESRNFQTYRSEGLQAFMNIGDGIEVAFMMRNGAEASFSNGPKDANMAWIVAVQASLSENTHLNTSVDFQEETTALGQDAKLAWVNSIGFKGVSTAWLAELNYLKIFSDDPKPRLAASFMMQYSFEDTISSDSDQGIFASVLMGNENYQEYAKETIRFSLGPYFQISKNLRTAFQGFYYQGVESTPGSDGYLLAWNWEARF